MHARTDWDLRNIIRRIPLSLIVWMSRYCDWPIFTTLSIHTWQLKTLDSVILRTQTKPFLYLKTFIVLVQSFMVSFADILSGFQKLQVIVVARSCRCKAVTRNCKAKSLQSLCPGSGGTQLAIFHPRPGLGGSCCTLHTRPGIRKVRSPGPGQLCTAHPATCGAASAGHHLRFHCGIGNCWDQNLF